MTELVNQPTALPTRKLTFAMIALLVAQGIAELVLMQLPPDTLVDGALLVNVLEGLFTTTATFVVGYFTRERRSTVGDGE